MNNDYLMVDVPLYGVPVAIFKSAESVNEFFGSVELGDGAEAIAGEGKEDCEGGREFVYMAFRGDGGVDANTLTHECIHAAFRVIKICNIKVSVSNHETLAYIAGWLAETAKAYIDGVNMDNEIDLSDHEKWDSRELGADESFVSVASKEERDALDSALKNNSHQVDDV